MDDKLESDYQISHQAQHPWFPHLAQPQQQGSTQTSHLLLPKAYQAPAKLLLSTRHSDVSSSQDLYISGFLVNNWELLAYELELRCCDNPELKSR